MKFTVLGGKLSPAIDLTIAGQLEVTDEAVERNLKNTGGLGLPTYREFKPAGKHLAVVGGGPSIEDHALAIRAFDGDVWAINGAWGWCKQRGIEATFVAVDPHPIVAKWAAGVKRAMLETRIDPLVFELLKDAEVYTFDVGEHKGGLIARGSTATAVPQLACRIGYHSVTFFGCESCFPPGASHAYQDEDRKDLLLIEAGGEDYLTAPDFYIQAHELSNFMREVPEYLKEESGGLLRALIQNPERHIKWISEHYAQGIRPANSEAA